MCIDYKHHRQLSDYKNFRCTIFVRQISVSHVGLRLTLLICGFYSTHIRNYYNYTLILNCTHNAFPNKQCETNDLLIWQHVSKTKNQSFKNNNEHQNVFNRYTTRL